MEPLSAPFIAEAVRYGTRDSRSDGADAVVREPAAYREGYPGGRLRGGRGRKVT